MAWSISKPRFETCPRCGSWFVSLEWDEQVSPQEVQDLWHCWLCQNEFITMEASEAKLPPASVTEVTQPFFTSLVME